jgi:hypothetical protein
MTTPAQAAILGELSRMPSDMRDSLARRPAGGVALADDDTPPAAEEGWTDFPSDHLPEPARSFVVEAAAALGASRAHVATPLLPALAAAIGTTRALELKAVWREVPVLWSALLAESGGHKSPALEVALAYANQRERLAGDEGSRLLADFDLEAERYAADLQSWRREAAKGRGGDPPRKPSRPPLPRYVVDDTTVEALAAILADNPRGLLLARDELGGWLGSFDRYSGGKGGGDSARWLSMHSAKRLTVDRKGSAPLRADAAAVSIVGAIPPRTFARALGAEHVDNGLLPRFLVAMPPRRRKTWTEDTVSFSTDTAMRDLFQLLYMLHGSDDGGPTVYDFTPEGLEAWIAFYNEHNSEVVAATGPVASMLSKGEAAAARLALVFHVVRQAGGESTLGNRVDAVDVAAGVAVSRWYMQEARRVYAALLGTGGSDDSALVAWLRDRGGRGSPRDVARGAPGFRGDTDRAEAALRRLVASGAARWETVSTGGRPSDSVVLL